MTDKLAIVNNAIASLESASNELLANKPVSAWTYIRPVIDQLRQLKAAIREGQQ